MGNHPRLEELVTKPTELSYYIGSNMPIQDHTRQELLEIDTTLARLKREIQLLEGLDTLRCNCCRVSDFSSLMNCQEWNGVFNGRI